MKLFQKGKNYLKNKFQTKNIENPSSIKGNHGDEELKDIGIFFFVKNFV